MKLVKALVIGAAIGGMALAINTEKVSAAEWVPRSVEQIQADLDKMTDDTYIIVGGDTLSILGQATGIPFVEIAETNGIADPDWIYEGDKLVFDRESNTVTIQSPTGETKAQISKDPETGNSSISTGGGSNATNTGNGSGNTTTNPLADSGSGSGSDNNGVNPTPPVGDDNGQTTPDREITKVVVSENEYFTRFRVGPFLDRDEASNWVRENYPNGLKGYEVDDSGDYLYIYIEVGHGNGGGDNGSGGGDVTTPPTDGEDNDSGGGTTPPEGGEIDEDKIPVNIGNSGIFAVTQEEANAQAWDLWRAGEFLEYKNFVIGPAFNAKGDIIGWTVHFRP